MLDLLTYISAIAVHQNGHYIDYQKFFHVAKKLIITTNQLQSLGILSHAHLRKVNNDILYKLHSEIRTNLPRATSHPHVFIPQTRVVQVPHSQELHLSNDNPPIQEVCNARISDRLNPPGGKFSRWSRQEEDFLCQVYKVHSINTRQRFHIFYNLCKDQNLQPIRTFMAFRKKIARK